MITCFEDIDAERSRIDERCYRRLKVSDWLMDAKEWKRNSQQRVGLINLEMNCFLVFRLKNG